MRACSCRRNSWGVLELSLEVGNEAILLFLTDLEPNRSACRDRVEELFLTTCKIAWTDLRPDPCNGIFQVSFSQVIRTAVKFLLPLDDRRMITVGFSDLNRQVQQDLASRFEFRLVSFRN